MKILFVIDTLGSGGKERRLTELLKALSHMEGIEIELVVMSNDIHFREVFDLGIRIHMIIRKTPKDLSVFRKFSNLITEMKPDAVHCWESMTAVYLAPVCRLHKCPLVNGMVTNVPVRQNILNHHWLRARLTFPFSAAIVSNTSAGLGAYSVPRARAFVIPNGFNFNRLLKLKERQDLRNELNIKTRFVVGMVASYSSSKDYLTYFRSAHSIIDRRIDATFLAIGAGTDSEDFIQLAGDRKEYFRFLGNQSDIESLVNMIDVGVLASFTEGFSNAVMEYMAIGKPVVASEVGGTPELVMEGETGFLVRRADHYMMADRIGLLLNDEGLRLRLGLNGRNRIMEHFSIEKMTKAYVSLYNNICNQ